MDNNDLHVLASSIANADIFHVAGFLCFLTDDVPKFSAIESDESIAPEAREQLRVLIDAIPMEYLPPAYRYVRYVIDERNGNADPGSRTLLSYFIGFIRKIAQ